MSFESVTSLEGGLKITNKYSMRDLLAFIKKNKNRRRSTPVLPWLIDIAFEDSETHFPDKQIEKVSVSKCIF